MNRKSSVELGKVSVKELGSQTWKDFEKLFERRGGVWGGCWCMYYHVTSGWSKRTSKQNRSDKRALVLNGKAHGLILYDDGEPVGWCQYGRPNELPRIDRKRFYEREGNFWRLTCFFVDKRYRMKGVSELLLEAALSSMKKRGVQIVEAYPVDTRGRKYRSDYLWLGTMTLFKSAGFRTTLRLGKSSVVMRKKI
jgi:GNAT superfamily N-acetyltransferase